MFTLNLVTPQKKILANEEIEEVFVPAFRGELNILPGHAPLMTTLTTGVLRYRLKGDSMLHAVAISWGYCEVNPEGVTVLAETAERADEIDMDRVNIAITKAVDSLRSPELTADTLEKYQNKIARATARQTVAGVAPTKH